MKSASLITVWFSFLAIVCSQDAGSFINPPVRSSTLLAAADPIYIAGNILPITWNPLANGTAALTIWQTDPSDLNNSIGTLQYLPGSQSIDGSSFNWSPIGVDGINGNPNFNLSVSNIFHFDLYVEGETSATSRTGLFNLTDSTINAVGQPISTSASSSSTSIAQSTSATASSSSIKTPAASASAAAATFPSSGLTTGAKIGIGLGIGLGVPILLAILAGIILLLRKKKYDQTTPVYAQPPTEEYKRPEYKHEMASPQPYTAVSGSDHDASPPAQSWQQPVTHELPSAQYR